MPKRVECAVCGETEVVTDENSTNGKYPDADGWIINEEDYSIRCSSWSCQDAPGKQKSGQF